MFAKWAKYLLGTQPCTQEQVVPCDVLPREVSADDGWVLIDSAIERAEDGNKDELEVSIFNLPEALAKEYSSSLSHPLLECNSLEESWFLTPPPCFMSEGPIYMETSPLENLLIEHPSMSVYQHSPSTHPQLNSVSIRKRWISAEDSSSKSDADIPQVKVKHVNLVSAQQQQQEKENIHMKYTQKIRQSRLNQVLKRTSLDRANKAREISSSKRKRQRRSDKQYNHSGANNNRKCYT